MSSSTFRDGTRRNFGPGGPVRAVTGERRPCARAWNLGRQSPWEKFRFSLPRRQFCAWQLACHAAFGQVATAQGRLGKDTAAPQERFSLPAGEAGFNDLKRFARAGRRIQASAANSGILKHIAVTKEMASHPSGRFSDGRSPSYDSIEEWKLRIDSESECDSQRQLPARNYGVS